MGSSPTPSTHAGMMELADVTDSKSVDGDIVWVRLPLPALMGMWAKGEPPDLGSGHQVSSILTIPTFMG